jgi:hypothetical protein
MKAAANRGGNVSRGVLEEARQKPKSSTKRKDARFDVLVARYYPAVFSFACRLTDDPRQAIVLTRRTFISARKQLRNCDENVFASMAMAAIIRAGVMAA